MVWSCTLSTDSALFVAPHVHYSGISVTFTLTLTTCFTQSKYRSVFLSNKRLILKVFLFNWLHSMDTCTFLSFKMSNSFVWGPRVRFPTFLWRQSVSQRFSFKFFSVRRKLLSRKEKQLTTKYIRGLNLVYISNPTEKPILHYQQYVLSTSDVFIIKGDILHYQFENKKCGLVITKYIGSAMNFLSFISIASFICSFISFVAVFRIFWWTIHLHVYRIMF